MKKILVALCVAGLSLVSFAQDAAAPAPEKKCPEARQKCPKGKKFHGKRHHNAKRGAEMWKRYAEINKQLKEKYPQEMAEVEALRKESFEKMKAANQKFMELAKKENIQLPAMKMMERKQKMDALKAKYADDFKALEDARKAEKAAREKIGEIMKKEGIECPKGPRGFRGPRK